MWGKAAVFIFVAVSAYPLWHCWVRLSPYLIGTEVKARLLAVESVSPLRSAYLHEWKLDLELDTTDGKAHGTAYAGVSPAGKEITSAKCIPGSGRCHIQGLAAEYFVLYYAFFGLIFLAWAVPAVCALNSRRRFFGFFAMIFGAALGMVACASILSAKQGHSFFGGDAYQLAFLLLACLGIYWRAKSGAGRGSRGRRDP